MNRPSPLVVLAAVPSRRLGSLALVLLMTACGARAPVSRTTLPPRAHVAPRFAPRLVRQRSADDPPMPGPYLASAGVRRAVDGDGYYVRVVDPDTGVVYAREVLADVYDASLDPTLRTLCFEQRELRAGAPTRVGAYDLERHEVRWTETLLPEGAEGAGAHVVATADSCVARYRDASGEHLVRLALADGARRDASGIELPDPTPESTVHWSDDHAVLVLARPADASGTRSRWVELFDGRTLARRAVLWARCIEVGRDVRIAMDEAVESVERREHLARTMPDVIAPGSMRCEPAADPPSTWTSGPIVLPSPWAPLSDDVLAVHDERGLFLWDHTHHASPRRVAGAPELVRFSDVNGASRPHELVVPPDASWVGVVRADETMARFAASDGAPLPDVRLPSASAGTRGAADEPIDPRDAQWQVFAGERDRLLAIRHVRGHRTVFVGDASGAWTRSPARAFMLIWQHAEHEDASATWLLSDPHYGVSRIDELTGRVVASHIFPDSWSRATRAARSPDGREIFVGFAPAGSDDAGGLYFLDAATLELVRRLDAGPWIEGPIDDVVWREDGVLVQGSVGLVVLPRWALIDPASGQGRVVARGALRIDWAPTWRGELHVDRAHGGGVLLSRGRGGAERWLALVGDGAVIEEPDGRVWCERAGCDVMRCVVSEREARPMSDETCGALVVR